MKTKLALLPLFALTLAFLAGCQNAPKRTARNTSNIDRTHNPYAAQRLTEQQQRIDQERLAALKHGEDLPPIAEPPLVQGNRAWGYQLLPSPF